MFFSKLFEGNYKELTDEIFNMEDRGCRIIDIKEY